MPRLHWLPANEPPGEGTLAGVRSWEWCQAHLENLTYLPTRAGHLPTLQHDAGERREVAWIRGRQYVVVELEQPEGGYRAGYYLSSITPQQLAEKLKEG